MAKKKEPVMNEAKVKETSVAKVHQYETIFTIVEHEKIFQIAVGNKLISRTNFETLEAAQAYIDSKPWELIVNATCAIYDLSKNIK